MEKLRVQQCQPQGEFVSLGGLRVFEDVILVLFEVVENPWGFGVALGELPEDGKSGTDATFLSDVLEIWIGVINVVAHLVGKSDEVEFAVVKSLGDDGVFVVAISVIFLGEKNDFFGLQD